MPQLDRLAYVSQVIWLISMFLFMYLVLLRTGLPRLYKVLRFRKDKLSLLNDGVIHSEKEVFFVGRSSRNLVLSILGSIRPVSDNVGKILESNLEDRKSSEKAQRSFSREVGSFNDFDIVSDLVTCKLIDENKYVKKGTVEKRVVSN